tara:strand:+ start:1035 stop:1580 length:546 start_codon:yes stop_codon:yes gene_type:complete
MNRDSQKIMSIKSRTSEFRRPLITTKLDNLTAETIQLSGGKIFADTRENPNLNDITMLVDSWRSIHAPTYGVHIPMSGTIVIKGGEAGLTKMFTATDNKTYKITGFSVTNAGAQCTVQIGLQDASSNFVTIFAGNATATATIACADLIGVTFDNSTFPAFLVTSGDPNDLAFEMSYCEIVQ